MQYLLRPDQHSHDFTSTPRPLSLPRCLIPFSRHRDVRGGLTALRHGGARKTRKRTHRTRKRFHEQEVFRISLQNPYNTISLIESKREFRKLIEERLGGRAQHGNTRGRRPDHSGWCPQGWIPQDPNITSTTCDPRTSRSGSARSRDGDDGCRILQARTSQQGAESSEARKASGSNRFDAHASGGGGQEGCIGQALQYAAAAGHARLAGPLEGGRGFAVKHRALGRFARELELSDQGSRSSQQSAIKI